MLYARHMRTYILSPTLKPPFVQYEIFYLSWWEKQQQKANADK